MTMVMGRAIHIRGERTTLGDVIKKEFETASHKVPNDVIEAMADEIWKAPENMHLQSAKREHLPKKETKTVALRLFPDECIFVPFPPSPRFEVGDIPISYLDIGYDQLCRVIDKLLEDSGLRFPGGKVTPERLKEIPFNAGLRTGAAQSKVFIYAVPKVDAIVDAAPTNDEHAVMNVGQATPDWLFDLWDLMDRLEITAENLSNAFAEMIDTRTEGRIIAEGVNMLSRLFEIIDREVKKELASYNPATYAMAHMPSPTLWRYTGLRSALDKYSATTKRTFIDRADGYKYPIEGTVDALVKEMDKLLTSQASLDTWQKFDSARSFYPATCQILWGVLARVACARSLTDTSSDFVNGLEQAALQNAVAAQSVMFKETASYFKFIAGMQTANDLGSVLALSAGNLPTPRSLLVAVAKINLLFKLPSPNLVKTADEYARLLGKTFALKDQNLASIFKTMREGPGWSRLFVAELASAEAATAMVHSGWKVNGTMTLVNILLTIYAFTTAEKNKQEGVPWNVSNWTDLANATGMAAGSLSGLVHMLGYVAKDAKVQASLAKSAALLGRLTAVLGLISGTLMIVDACKAKGSEDIDRVKLYQGIGTVLVSSQPMLEMAISRFGPRILVWATLHAVRWMTAEAAIALAAIAGQTLAAIASMASIVGGVILLACILYSNRNAIQAIFKDLTMPGTRRLCEAYLAYIKGSHVFGIAPERIRADHAVCADELENAYLLDFVPGPGGLEELKKIGMNHSDFELLGHFAALTPNMMMQPF
jgi:hypothetical protein